MLRGSCAATALLAACIGLLAAPARARAADDLQVATRDGVRHALVLPAARGPAPAVLVLHGATLTAQWTATSSGFAQAAAAKGFAAVFPDGLGRQWNDGREGEGADDVGFLRQLVGELIERRIALAQRIYIAGISNGGMMAFRMLCEAGELFAGAGTVIANMPAAVGATCRLRKPFALTMLNGTADPLVPYGGGGVGFMGWRGEVWSAERTAQFVADANGCQPRTLSQLPKRQAEITRIARLRWAGCRDGATVSLYRIDGGGHQIFGRTNFLPAVLGAGTEQISAPRVIMEAFAAAGGG
jgi:polyhydroxybutyrate depolymerase